jgi:hypothetical protein
MEKSMKTKRIATLQCTTLFGGLTAETLTDIAQRAVELHLKRGEMLFLSGEPARGLFVVVSGKIRVFQQNEDGRGQVMHVNAAGSVLGDVPVFDDGPYPASAIKVALLKPISAAIAIGSDRPSGGRTDHHDRRSLRFNGSARGSTDNKSRPHSGQIGKIFPQNRRQTAATL